MLSVRTAAACVAVVIGLAAGTPAIAQNAASPAASAPLKLNQFMKTAAKPVAPARKASLASSPAKAASKPAAKPTRVAAKTPLPAAATRQRTLLRSAHRSPRPRETAPVQTTGLAPRESETAPADRVKVMSFNEINELDLAADNVQVVAQDQLNELDAAADTPPGPAQEQGKAGEGAGPTPASPATETGSWLQRILLAVGGILAAGVAARMWIG